MTLRLELRHITKQYPSVRANDAVSLKVRPGEIHAVLGENGAGKSTLMKIIFGAVKPDAGEILFNGKALPRALNDRDKDTLRRIQMIYQSADTSLNPKQTIRDIRTEQDQLTEQQLQQQSQQLSQLEEQELRPASQRDIQKELQQKQQLLQQIQLR